MVEIVQIFPLGHNYDPSFFFPSFNFSVVFCVVENRSSSEKNEVDPGKRVHGYIDRELGFTLNKNRGLLTLPGG